MNLSIISDKDDFDCYNRSEGKPVQTKIDDAIQLLPKENNLTPEQCINIEKPKTPKPIRKFKRLPFAKQSEKLGGIPYKTNNNKKKNTNNRNLLQEKTITTTDRSEKENNRTIRENNEEIQSIRPVIMTSTVDLVQTVTYGLRQRDLVLYTNKIRITVTLLLCLKSLCCFVTKIK